MPEWNLEYFRTLQEKFENITEELDDCVEDIVQGRVTPALDDINIGSARHMRAAVLFFDIRDFSGRTQSAELLSLKQTLIMLDCLIPVVMQIVYDYGGIIEKNTGDGIMAIIGAEDSDDIAANNALNIAVTIFYVIKKIVNPYLVANGIPNVNARIGIDLGPLLIARIGLPRGTSRHHRNFLTAVGPAANLASKIQHLAGTNEIWVGDLIKSNTYGWREEFYVYKTPPLWTWIYTHDASKYNVWHYNAIRKDPS